MKSYLLLRNNVETGPFSREEIIAQQLVSTDLVWIEGESATWKHPAEIDDLQPFSMDTNLPAESPGFENGNAFTASKGIFVALPAQYGDRLFITIPEKTEAPEEVVLETRFSQPLEALKEKRAATTQNNFRFRRTFSKPHNALWLVSVFAGLLFSAFVIKRVVDAGVNNLPTQQAAAQPAIDIDESKQVDEGYYQNALATELVPVDTITLKPVKKAPRKINLRKLVQLEANDYHVGLLGGIKNLRLLVTNNSAFVLDRVKIRLQYLKPNGDVIKTENLLMKKVNPKSSKSLAVSAQKRGVKIKYLITDIESTQNTALMLRL